jgi:hypothetical protein
MGFASGQRAQLRGPWSSNGDTLYRTSDRSLRDRPGDRLLPNHENLEMLPCKMKDGGQNDIEKCYSHWNHDIAPKYSEIEMPDPHQKSSIVGFGRGLSGKHTRKN